MLLAIATAVLALPVERAAGLLWPTPTVIVECNVAYACAPPVSHPKPPESAADRRQCPIPDAADASNPLPDALRAPSAP